MGWFICGANVLGLLCFAYIYFLFFWHCIVGSSTNHCCQGEQIRNVTRNAPCMCELLCTRMSNSGIFTNKIRVQAAISEGSKRYHSTHLMVEALLTLFRLINSFRCLELMSEACPVWHVLYHVIWINDAKWNLNYSRCTDVKLLGPWLCITGQEVINMDLFYHTELLRSGAGNFL